jgi:hypothetical protein
MSNGSSGTIIVGLGTVREPPDDTSPIVQEIRDMWSRLGEIKNFVQSNGNDTLTIAAINAARHGLGDIDERAVELHDAL